MGPRAPRPVGAWTRPERPGSDGPAWRALALVCLLTAIGAGGARAEIVSYQQGDGKGVVSDTDDARMNSGSASTNYGSDTTLVVDKSTENHSVLKFANVIGTGPNQIPPGSTILGATLTMYVVNDGANDGLSCPEFYQLTESWAESEVTWDDRVTAVSWTDTGADGPTSRKPTSEGTIACDPVGFYGLDVSASVQNWADGEPNEGWVIVDQGVSVDGVDFSSSEEPTAPQRPQLTVEFVPSVFYSVGTNAADLKTGSPKMDLVAGVATLDVAQAQDIGVGDVVDFGGSSTLVYIWEVVSPTQVRVQNGDGTLPPDAANQDVNSIKRAFNSIGNAVTGSVNAAYLGNGDLTAVNRRLTWICYDDGPFNVSSTTTISGYTTDATRFITLTVAGASQVVTGRSQRHQGVAGTGARLEATSSGIRMLQLNEAYTVVEWLELDGNDLANVEGARVSATADGARLTSLVIHNTRGSGSTGSGVYVEATPSAHIRNTMAYDYGGDGILSYATNLTVANSTLYLGQTSPSSNAIQAGGGAVLAENVIGVGGAGLLQFCALPVGSGCNGSLTCNNCLSSDSTADDYGGSGNLINRPATDQFRSLIPVDLHLRAGADALDAGKDLSGSFTNDIDDQARPLGASWDIGADEGRLTVEPYYRSIGTAAPLVNQGTITVTVGSPVVTKGGGLGWLAQNRGRGDVLTVGVDEYMIQGVVSDNELLIASLPTTGYVGGAYTIDRQHTTLTGWYDCVANNAVCPYFPVSSSSLIADDRREVGIVYKDSVLSLGATWDLRDATTDADHDIVLTADAGNRHLGIRGVGARIDNNGFDIRPADSFLTIEWLEIYGGGTRGLHLADATSSPSRLVLRYLMLRDHGAEAIRTFGFWDRLEIYTNIIFSSGQGIDLDNTPLPTETLILNNTVYANTAGGIVSGNDPNPGVILFNNVSLGNGLAAYDVPNLDAGASGYNLASDSTGTTHSGVGGGKNGLSPRTDPSTCPDVDGCVGFQQLGVPQDFHLIATVYTNEAVDAGSPDPAIMALIPAIDVDSQWRTGTWDAGADEFGATTAVELVSFTARPGDQAVDLAWETGSELDNLGFHVHRSESESGPWTRVNPELIPGLGSSPVGASYSWPDMGLQNGVEYFYLLEDVDTASVSTYHGPVSAVPVSSEGNGEGGGEEEGGGEDGPGEPGGPGGGGAGASQEPTEAGPPPCADDALPGPCTATHGDPGPPSLRVVSRSVDHVLVELTTPGFEATHESSGRVRVSIPGFDRRSEPRAPDLPLRRLLLDAEVGRRSRLAWGQAFDEQRYPGLVPEAVGFAEMEVRPDGTIRPGRRPATLDVSAGGVLPPELASTQGEAFQGQSKTLSLELSPVRYDTARQELVLARRLLVRVDFVGRDGAETGAGRIGRRAPRRRPGGGRTIAFLHTVRRGLHRVSFEEVHPSGARSLPLRALSLERLGEAVPFRVEPDSGVFGPGSVLYFFADRVASSGAFTDEVAWELVRSPEGARMATAPALPFGSAVSDSLGWGQWETNRIYQPGLLEAPDLWLWDAVPGGASRSQVFSLEGHDGAASVPARITLHLQGGSDAAVLGDHHLRVRLGGAPVGDTTFGGKVPHAFSLEVPASQLLPGANEITVENLGDTGVHSLVFLDRIEVKFPQLPALRDGRFEAVAAQAGSLTIDGVAPGADPVTASAMGLTRGPGPAGGRPGPGGTASRTQGGGPGVIALDITDTGAPVWLTSVEVAGSSARLRVEAGRRYALAAPEGVLVPRVQVPERSTLRSPRNQADYILVAPEAFLPAAEPLIARRQDQGLTTRAVSLETIAAVFGRGQPSADAIRSFLSFAFHEWTAPAPRYVVLLGDSSFDPRNFTGVAPPAPLPALWSRTSYLWTVSDPALAAVNGEDSLPDMAIGRLPAATVEEAEGLVQKVLDWEASGQTLEGTAVLVADNPDGAGDFEADVRDITENVLTSQRTRTLFIRNHGAYTRPRILEAFDDGLSLVSYVGHGGSAIWASENVLNSFDPPSLLAQPRQPLMLTLNCLNGYFVAPTLDSLAEAFLKVEGRGTIAAISPSGLSEDGPAHQFHRAVVGEIARGGHARLGDAVLAAQETYARQGLMPELLSVYHLLGDPGMVLQ